MTKNVDDATVPEPPRLCKQSSLWDHARNRVHRLFAAENALGFGRSVRSLHAVDALPECVMRYEHRIELLPLLPHALQFGGCNHWQLLFSSQVHGCSLTTLYERSHSRGPTLVLVRDKQHHVFGAFASVSWAREPDAHYHGSGESFLFSTWPAESGLRSWAWTGVNRHCQLAAHDCLAFGGGGHFGLWLGRSLATGSTARCDTYGNGPLTEHHVEGGLTEAEEGQAAFEVHEVQVWALEAGGRGR